MLEQPVDPGDVLLGDQRGEHRRAEIVGRLEEHVQRFGHTLGGDLGLGLRARARACCSSYAV